MCRPLSFCLFAFQSFIPDVDAVIVFLLNSFINYIEFRSSNSSSGNAKKKTLILYAMYKVRVFSSMVGMSERRQHPGLYRPPAVIFTKLFENIDFR